MESSYTPYKIVFFDGHEEFDNGHVGLHPLLTFKRFQGLISQKIRLSESQSRLCKILLICGNSRNNKPRKLPINENTNFRILLKSTSEKDCYFSVSMKKSRREMRDVQPKAASHRKRCSGGTECRDFGSFSAVVIPPVLIRVVFKTSGLWAESIFFPNRIIMECQCKGRVISMGLVRRKRCGHMECQIICARCVLWRRRGPPHFTCVMECQQLGGQCNVMRGSIVQGANCGDDKKDK
eukprot:Gb_06536 [translate_table: standard]